MEEEKVETPAEEVEVTASEPVEGVVAEEATITSTEEQASA